MKYVVPEVSSCVRNLHFKLRYISTKCFLSVFTVSVQLEEGDWFIYIYTRFIYIRKFNMYMYLCALRIKSKKQRNIHIL